MTGTFTFKKQNADTVSISGILPAFAAPLTFLNKSFTLNVGGAKAAFTLTTKAAAVKNTAGTAALKVKFSKGVYVPGKNVPFTAKYKGSFTGASIWNISKTVTSKQPQSFVVFVVFESTSVFTATAVNKTVST